MVDDSYSMPRMEYLLNNHADNSLDMLGVLRIIQLRHSRQPWRRCAAYRLVFSICKQHPELVSPDIWNWSFLPCVQRTDAALLLFEQVLESERAFTCTHIGLREQHKNMAGKPDRIACCSCRLFRSHCMQQ